jgi:hypothetical protein
MLLHIDGELLLQAGMVPTVKQQISDTRVSELKVRVYEDRSHIQCFTCFSFAELFSLLDLCVAGCGISAKLLPWL